MRKLADASLAGDVDKITETYVRQMANQSAAMAPVKDSYLRNSIMASPQQESKGVWTYGSNLPYAQRQEYEHRSHKGFIRKSVWRNRGAYREAVKKRVKKAGG